MGRPSLSKTIALFRSLEVGSPISAQHHRRTWERYIGPVPLALHSQPFPCPSPGRRQVESDNECPPLPRRADDPMNVTASIALTPRPFSSALLPRHPNFFLSFPACCRAGGPTRVCCISDNLLRSPAMALSIRLSVDLR